MGRGVEGQLHGVVGDLLVVDEPVLALALLQRAAQHGGQPPEEGVLLGARRGARTLRLGVLSGHQPGLGVAGLGLLQTPYIIMG